MTITSIAANIPEPLNVLRGLTTQCTLDDVILINQSGDLNDLRLGQVTSLSVWVDAGLCQNVVRKLRANAMNIPEGIPDLLLLWDVNACNTWHGLLHSNRQMAISPDAP
jgi:hypothetical protein